MVGTVVPRSELLLGFTHAARLAEQSVSTGDHVVAGQVLARTDDSALRLAVEAARAQARMGQAALDEAIGIASRQKTLNERSVVSNSAWDQADLHQATAAARFESAKAQLAIAEDALDDAALIATHDGVVTVVTGEGGEIIGAGMPVITVADPSERNILVDAPENLTAFLRLGDR